MRNEKLWSAVSSNWQIIQVPDATNRATQTTTCFDNGSQTVSTPSEYVALRHFGTFDAQVVPANTGVITGAYGVIVLDTPVSPGPPPIFDALTNGDADWLYWSGFGINNADGETDDGRTVFHDRWTSKSRRRIERRESLVFVITCASTSPTPPPVRYRFSLRTLLIN